jgi:hypothetical protein
MNLRAYINGFSDNMRVVLEKFDFDNTIAKLDEAGHLFKVVQRFKEKDLQLMSSRWYLSFNTRDHLYLRIFVPELLQNSSVLLT